MGEAIDYDKAQAGSVRTNNYVEAGTSGGDARGSHLIESISLTFSDCGLIALEPARQLQVVQKHWFMHTSLRHTLHQLVTCRIVHIPVRISRWMGRSFPTNITD